MVRNLMVLFVATFMVLVVFGEKKEGLHGRYPFSQDELQDVSSLDYIVPDKHSRFARQASTKKVSTTSKKGSTLRAITKKLTTKGTTKKATTVKATSKKANIVASTTKKKTPTTEEANTVRSSSKKPTTVKATTKKRTTLVRSTSTTKKVTLPKDWLREDTGFTFILLDTLSSSTTALTTHVPRTTLPPEDDTTDVYSEPIKEYQESNEQNDVEEDSETSTYPESYEDSPAEVDEEPSIVIPASESSTTAAGSSTRTIAKLTTRKSTMGTASHKRRVHVAPRHYRYFNGFSFVRRYRGQRWWKD